MTQRSLTTRIGTSAFVAMLMFAMMVGLGRSVPTALADRLGLVDRPRRVRRCIGYR